ncbi:siderophore-interacting protein [Frigoribacterium sp. PvP032]|uniref:siderophore-interacting protein n=1 Tax=Frigoribacterium sp. PvP032 TaxID=2806589 RepID=UPI001B5ABF56|nr:siderophore-interacting protein [Frigoribacterium sp. PvP032]MBP1190502.1 NADPH-dependent ferric siderophore reductase [Frigoribacterium sp. PvP032]
MTITTEAPPEARPKPAHRPYRVRVAALRALSPHFVRVTFTGDDLGDFGVDGLDQRIKLVLPLEATGYDTFPTDDWWPSWRALPAHEQNAFRTYTAKAVRPHAREVDVDFVSHGDHGAAASWLARTRVGDEAMLIGPDATSGVTGSGVEWAPGGASTVMIAGDETAVPAITSIVESLPADARGCVFLEVPTADDVLPLVAPPGVTVHWLPRSGGDTGQQPAAAAAAYGAPLQAAVRGWTARYVTAWHRGVDLDEVDIEHDILWDVPQGEAQHGAALQGELYAWLAGEAGAIKALRRFLVSEVGVDRRQVAFMGYWRLGRAEM